MGGEKLMTVFTFHFAKTRIGTTIRALCRPPTGQQVPGLNHAECMTRMTLGAPILSPTRLQLRHLTMFAAWDSHVAIDEFLADTGLGRALATGWRSSAAGVMSASSMDLLKARENKTPQHPWSWGRVLDHCGQIKQGVKGPQEAFFSEKSANEVTFSRA
jgi:hypothetical protein